MEQVNAVRRMYANRSGKKQVYNKSLNAFKADASWRHHPASDAQIKKLKQLGLAQVEVVNKGLTKGEASDMISGVFVAMASPQQLQQLKERLGPEAVADLPVPLLQAYATTLLTSR